MIVKSGWVAQNLHNGCLLHGSRYLDDTMLLVNIVYKNSIAL
jgi:hypothetical protein